MTKIDELIKLTMDGFDFNKVHSAMKALNLEWNFGQGEKRVPTLEELKYNAKLQLIKSSETTPGYFYSGGLEAYFNGRGFELKFVLEKSKPFGLINKKHL